MLLRERGAVMLIKSSTALRNEYDKIVGLSKMQQEPVYITRNGEGEMVFCLLKRMSGAKQN